MRNGGDLKTKGFFFLILTLISQMERPGALNIGFGFIPTCICHSSPFEAILL